MNNENEILMSQLADGELPSDQANELLLGVLDNSNEREKLKNMLRLRQATADWRTHQPTKPILVMADRPRSFQRNRVVWRMGGLAAAACIGGLLVLTGLWAAGWVLSPVRPAHPWQISPAPDSPTTLARVSPEQMRQVAQAFELHESVAGPLAWYAADDQNIRLASAQGAQSGRPIAVLLRLETDASPARTLVIVCREDSPAVIELPSETPSQTGLRVYLAPKTTNGKVQMHYTIAADGDSRDPVLASLTGQRHLGLAETSLGQLAMDDRILNIEAAAWPLR